MASSVFEREVDVCEVWEMRDAMRPSQRRHVRILADMANLACSSMRIRVHTAAPANFDCVARLSQAE